MTYELKDSETAGRVFSITLPMRMSVSNKKVKAINLNIYRNLHHFSLAFQKKAFHKTIFPLLKQIPKLNKIQLHYDIFPKSKRRLDTMNVGSIVDKYFSDSLVEAKIIDDDDYSHITFVSFGFGGIVENEHIIVTITEIKTQKEEKMRILLDQDDIQIALNTFVETQGIAGSTGVELSVNTDGEITAEVMIGDFKSTKTPVKRKTRTKNTAKTKEPENVSLEEASTSSNVGNDSGDSSSTENNSEAVKPNDETKDSEDKKSKNLFEENPEESSTSSEEEKTEDKSVRKKGSIFDN